jgi:hypothetical protein
MADMTDHTTALVEELAQSLGLHANASLDQVLEAAIAALEDASSGKPTTPAALHASRARREERARSDERWMLMRTQVPAKEIDSRVAAQFEPNPLLLARGFKPTKDRDGRITGYTPPGPKRAG